MEHRVRDLPVEARHWVEYLVGRPVTENDTISVRAIPVVKDAPPYEERLKIADDLQTYFAGINQKIEGMEQGEFDEAAEEALRVVRASHRTVR